jgi:protein-S-isoprenylcysteine O-methyltransferase Ste14
MINIEFIFRLLVAALIIGFVIHRGNTTRKNTPTKESIVKERESDKSQTLTAILGLVALFSTLIFIFFPNWIAFASLEWPSWLRWLGLVPAIGGFAILEWEHNNLGVNWSDTPLLQKQHTLTTQGPYKWIRHPIYSGFIFILSAPLLLSSNWLLGSAWLLMMIIDV